MTKLCGAALVAAAGMLYCLQFFRESRKGYRELASIASMLEMLAGELEANRAPLTALVCALSKKMTGSPLRFLRELQSNLRGLGEKSFQSLWTKSVNACFDYLEWDELQALDELGTALGRFELERQLAAIGTCREFMRRRAEQRKEALREKTRLHTGLACSASALIIILLL